MPDATHEQTWHDALRADLARRENAGLLRRLRPLEPGAGLLTRIDEQGRPIGKPLINLASNDYLGLSHHPHLIDAAVRATQRFGTGAGASRLVTGTGPLHQQTERAFAAFKHADAALLFPTGYMANLAVLATLAQRGDLICLDKLNHASLLAAARATGAEVRVYPHLDTKKLERLLARHASAHDSGRSRLSGPATNSDQPTNDEITTRPPLRFIVTDSIFSMDGDCADLPALADLRDRYNAILIIDEAHGTGVLGPTGAGLAEHQQVVDKIDIVISTASKALGSLGGIVTAPQPVIDTLINAGRSFIYTTAVPPAQAASILAALDVIRDEPQRREKLRQLSLELRDALAAIAQRSAGKLRTLPLRENEPATPIIPLIIGDERPALALAAHLESQGFLIPAIRPPTVPRGTSRLRISLRADLDRNVIPRLVDAINAWL